MKIFRYRLDLKKIQIFHKERLSYREGILLNDENFWGECSPLPGFSKESLQDSLKLDPKFPSVAFGLSTLKAKIRPIPPISSWNLVSELSELKNFLGANILKVKVARQDLNKEITTLKNFCEDSPNTKLILDANLGWNIADASLFMKKIPQDRILHIEDPCPSTTESIKAAKLGGIKIALDENFRDNSDLNILSLPEISALVIKPTLWGSLENCEKLINFALKNQVTPIISSSIESPLGLSLITSWAEKFSSKVLLGLDTAKMFSDPNVFSHMKFLGEKIF